MEIISLWQPKIWRFGRIGHNIDFTHIILELLQRFLSIFLQHFIIVLQFSILLRAVVTLDALAIDKAEVFLAPVGLKDLLLQVISGHNFTLLLNHVNFWKLESWLGLVSIQTLRLILATQMRLIALLYRLAVAINELIFSELLF